MAGQRQSATARVHPRTLAFAAAGVAVVVLVAAIVAATQQDRLRAAGAEAPVEEDAFLNLDGAFDTDNDGLSDATENYVTGSDPRNWSSSGGPIPDGWLHRYGYDPLLRGVADRPAASPPADVVPASHGADGRTLLTPTLWQVYSFQRPADWDESTDGPFQNGIDPRDWDQNDDGIPDGYLLRYGLDPKADLEDHRLAGSGGFTVAEAFEHNTDPTRLDTDGDGLPDTVEVSGGPLAGGFTFPPTDPARFDSNGAGVCDGFLAHQGIDPHDVVAARGDGDNDGATAVEEFLWSLDHYGPAVCRGEGGLRLNDATSGSSVIPDGWHVKYDLNPLQSGVDGRATPSKSGDPAMTVLDEYRVNRPVDWDETQDGPWWGGTDPSKPDTDGDGLGDAREVQGYTINVATDVGATAVSTEQLVRPDPTRVDTDRDGIPDGKEAEDGSDATRRDTDLDGLSDQFEAGVAGLDPLKADSAHDLLRDGARHALLTSLAQQYGKDLAYAWDGPGGARLVTDWLRDCDGNKATGAQVPAMVGPDGDLDCDGEANLVDEDIDGDGLVNGIEVDPTLYVRDELDLGPLERRTATDPLNADTDGDLLPDRWEVKYGVPLFSGPAAGRYDLDPADWDTDGNGVSDGEEDPDRDSIQWLRFTPSATGSTPEATPFPYRNLEEYLFETDPHDDTSDNDGLLDGWKVFWGQVYSGPIDRDAVRPIVRLEQPDALMEELVTIRVSAVDSASQRELPHESTTDIFDDVDDGKGGTRTLYEVTSQFRYTLQAAQAASTNPYLHDTDLDGIPDAYEVLLASAPPDPECDGDAGLSAVAHDAGEDVDHDGLASGQEYDLGLHPLCPDTDHGTIPDGTEVGSGMLPLDHRDDLLETFEDLDGDGITDVEERRTHGTDPHDPDTDGDGLLDGGNVDEDDDGGALDDGDDRTNRFLDLGIVFQRHADDTYTFLGESGVLQTPRPLQAFPDGIQVPQGWLFSRDRDPESRPADASFIQSAYDAGKPSWWREADHGPWWGGATTAEVASGTLPGADADADGLDDALGEDPVPVANHYNVPRDVDEAVHGLAAVAADPRDATDPAEARVSAQALVNPRVITNLGLQRDTDPGRFNDDADHTARQTPALTISSAPATVQKGSTFTVAGDLMRGSAGVSGVTVVAELAGEPVGVGVTDDQGAFSVAAAIQSQHTLDVPAGALVVMGERSGTVTFETDTARITPGSHTLRLYSYATPNTDDFTATWDPVHGATATLGVEVRSVPTVSLSAPQLITAGGDMPLTVSVTDGSGDPLAGSVVFTTPNGDLPSRTLNGEGTAAATVTTTPGDAGAFPVSVTFTPVGTHVDGATVAADPVPSVLLRTSLSLDLLEPKVKGGEVLEVSGRLTSTGSQPVAGALVTVSVAGTDAPPVATRSDGRFSVDAPVPADQSPGSIVVLAKAAQTDRTEPASSSATTTVLGLPVIRDQSLHLMTLGQDVPIRGTITKPDGSPLANAIVHYRLGDGERTGRMVSGADGTFEEDVDWVPPAGPTLQTLTYAGDAEHAAASSTKERFLQSATSLAAEAGEVARGAPLEMGVTLEDAVGRAVPGARLVASAGEAPTSTVEKPVPLVTDTRVTDADGKATFVLPTGPLPLGLHEVRVTFAGSGDGSLQESALLVPWNVVSALEVRLAEGPFVAGDAPPQPKLVDAGTGAAVVKELSLTPVVDGVPGKTATFTPRADGTFDLFATFPDATEPRIYRWVASFAGDEAYPAFDQDLEVRVLLPVDVDARLDALPVAGRTVNLLVDVFAPGGEPGSGTATAFLDDEEVGFSELRNGRASIPLRVDEAGAAQLRVEYGGSLRHAPEEHEQTLEVLSPTNLEVTMKSLRGGRALVEVVATGPDGPLAFRTVHVGVEGVGGFNVETDESGRASLTLAGVGANRTVSARLDAQAGEEQTLATASVGPALPGRGDIGFLLTVLAGVVALLLIVALAGAATWLWNRRSPLEMELRETLRSLRGRGAAEEVILHAYYVLQRAALRRGWLEDEAATPRLLQETLTANVRRIPGKPLDALIGLFEMARYGGRAMEPQHRDLAIRALSDIRRTTAWGGRP